MRSDAGTWTRYLVPLGRVAFAGVFVAFAPANFTQQGIAWGASQGIPLARVLVPLAGVISLLGGPGVQIPKKDENKIMHVSLPIGNDHVLKHSTDKEASMQKTAASSTQRPIVKEIAVITPCLWFDGQAEEAAKFYVSLFPDSHIDKVVKAPADFPMGKEGDVRVGGRNFMDTKRNRSK